MLALEYRTSGAAGGLKLFSERYQQLLEYTKKFPRKKTLERDYDPKLYDWYRSQLRRMNRSDVEISENQQKIRELGLSLESSTPRRSNWDERYAELLAYFEHYPNRDSIDRNENPQLRQWLQRETRRMRDQDYDPQRKKKLRSLGFGTGGTGGSNKARKAG